MSRRGYDRRRVCAEDGCREVTITNYEFKRDYADAARREKSQPPWKCLRHSRPREVLSTTNRATVGVLECVESEYGSRFWHNGERSTTGWEHGPGFMAWAKDFPVGTKLVVSTDIELPDGFTPPPVNESDHAKPTPPTYFADPVELD
ncbi:MAG: hypothetical protein PGN37_20485 [Mycobacterium kyogaense]|uniref:hypothetical protein n=1 Tax=Mycobacterium kyogaense TaxID=2212479 RepID=UPI002FF780BC